MPGSHAQPSSVPYLIAFHLAEAAPLGDDDAIPYGLSPHHHPAVTEEMGPHQRTHSSVSMLSSMPAHPHASSIQKIGAPVNPVLVP